MGSSGFTVSVHGNISEIASHDWDACAQSDDLLVAHRHLKVLETSGLAVPENGFTPMHVAVRDKANRILAVAPTYLKTSSTGEHGVDFGFAFAHDRTAGKYYPKLQVEVPFFPWCGERLLVRPGSDRHQMILVLLSALKELAAEKNASSVQIAHMLLDKDLPDLGTHGFDVCESNTYVWEAGQDRSFDDFLARMRKSRRGKIRRERREVQNSGIVFRNLRGNAIPQDISAPFFERYKDNFDRHDTPVWLNQKYFEQVFMEMSDDINLLISEDAQGLNGVLFSFASESLGQAVHWGLSRPLPFLHFEQTYYQSIDRAFDLGIKRLFFGMAGAHKAVRGLNAVPFYNAFWFRNPEFRDIAKTSCSRRTEIARQERIAELARLPFKTKN
jgi:predicted N-acyltransferase